MAYSSTLGEECSEIPFLVYSQFCGKIGEYHVPNKHLLDLHNITPVIPLGRGVPNSTPTFHQLLYYI